MQLWEEILSAREAWLGKRPSKTLWPASGLAIEGDFAGIQQFVLKPVPGAKGAAKRLRGRSLQVSALTELIAQETGRTFENAKVFYSAGGKFLLFATATDDWPQRLAHLQTQLDNWIGPHFRGEVVFHLAAAPFANGQIPRDALRRQLDRRKQRSLEHFLQTTDNGGGWAQDSFLIPAQDNPFVCPACRTTANEAVEQSDEEGEIICTECDRDKALGASLAKLSKSKDVRLAPSADGPIHFLDKRYAIADTGIPANVIHHMPPPNAEGAMDFNNIAAHSRGSRKFLAYLRIDADSIGTQFHAVRNDASKVHSLSRLLQLFFCDNVQQLIQTGAQGRYKNLYPVYGGGDDLFVIGPWDLAIDFADDLAAEFKKATAGHLHFSAGIALAKPKQHILTKSEEAAMALNEHAKKRDGKASIRILGETFSWQEFRGVLQAAQKMTKWHDEELISTQFLQTLLGLHGEWSAGVKEQNEAKQVRHKPMVHYQIERNLTNPKQAPVKEWLRKMLTRQAKDLEASWASIGFVVRYAMLAAQKENEEDL